MKLENRTIQILKNFSTINPSLLFREGNVLTTISSEKTVLAAATTKETFPKSFAISELSRFLGVLSLFDEPEIDIHDVNMTIFSGKQKAHYTFANPRMILSTDATSINMPDADIKFTLTYDDLQRVTKALAVLQLTEIAITGENGDLYLEAINLKNVSSDTYRVRIKETDHTFRIVFKAEDIKIMSGTYNVSISSEGIAEFKGDDVTYWIAGLADSTFEA